MHDPEDDADGVDAAAVFRACTNKSLPSGASLTLMLPSKGLSAAQLYTQARHCACNGCFALMSCPGMQAEASA